MFKIRYWLLISVLTLQFSLKAQVRDTVERKKDARLCKQLIIPGLFIAAGTTIHLSDGALNKKDIQTAIRGNNVTFRTHIDDYLQFAPIAEMYVANMFKVPARNNMLNQTKMLVLSELGTGIIVQILKYSLNVPRPDGGTHSFPSGHTSQSFSGASVLYMEYKNTSPVLAYSGFAFAGTVGYLRIKNNKHFLSDVLAGAGIAMAVTALVYHCEPLKNWDPFKKSNGKISFNYSEYGAGIKYMLVE